MHFVLSRTWPKVELTLLNPYFNWRHFSGEKTGVSASVIEVDEGRRAKMAVECRVT